MDEEIDIINRNTRIQKLKNILISKRKQIVSFLIFIVFSSDTSLFPDI